MMDPFHLLKQTRKSQHFQQLFLKRKLNVNKLEGPDDIHPRVLSENSHVLAYPLKLIFETSFSLRKLPL